MGLLVVHLSDIHFEDNSNAIEDKLDDLKRTCASKAQVNSTVIIVVSGDVAFSGKEAEYRKADAFFNTLREYIKLEKKCIVKFIISPGNHDCNFLYENTVRSVLVESAMPEKVDVKYYNQVTEVQKNFYSFVKQYNLLSTDMISFEEIEYGNSKVGFLVTNTAWMSELKEKQGKIFIPKQFFKKIDINQYSIIFGVQHHPLGWFNPEYSDEYRDYLRQSVDIVLQGHEHKQDTYRMQDSYYSMVNSQGKELQNTSNDADSGFMLFQFEDNLESYIEYKYIWENDKYVKIGETTNKFERNLARDFSPYTPKKYFIGQIQDIGIPITHFAKENVALSDLYIWPDLTKMRLKSSKNKDTILKENVFETLNKNSVNVIIGESSSGKTAFARSLFMKYASLRFSCIKLDGRDFRKFDNLSIKSAIDIAFKNQYDADIDEFDKLPIVQKVIIIDDFDKGVISEKNKEILLNYLFDNFGKIYITISSNVEIPTLIKSKAFHDNDALAIYTIRALGNKKRRELITKWYTLNELTRSDDEVESRISKAEERINVFLGNGAKYIPAFPFVIISLLQSMESVSPQYNGSQYGYLYETMIQKSLSSVAPEYLDSGMYNIAINLLSELAYCLLKKQHMAFDDTDLEAIAQEFYTEKKIMIDTKKLLEQLCQARILCFDKASGNVYKFKYPYIYYFFVGHYIAYHLSDRDVKNEIEYLSSRLYIEAYGNIMIFVCHFANSTEIIETVLLNAFDILSDYLPFDISKKNVEINELNEGVVALVPQCIIENSGVKENKTKSLEVLDNAGINDGQVSEEDQCFDDVEKKERDLAALSAAMKTQDVLSQIIKNYPGNIDGSLKIEIVKEIFDLGMRSVDSIIKIYKDLENDFIDYVISRKESSNKLLSRNEIEVKIKQFFNVLGSGVVCGMIRRIAMALGSKFLFPAIQDAFEYNDSLASRLVLVEYKLTCLKEVDYQNIKQLKESLDKEREIFASCILSSIVGNYLNYNQCDYRLRQKLCSLFGFSYVDTLSLPSPN